MILDKTVEDKENGVTWLQGKLRFRIIRLELLQGIKLGRLTMEKTVIGFIQLKNQNRK